MAVHRPCSPEIAWATRHRYKIATLLSVSEAGSDENRGVLVRARPRHRRVATTA